jgi:poly-gamma-glutamate system protein
MHYLHQSKVMLLGSIFVGSVVMYLVSEKYLITRQERHDISKMRNALSLAERWFTIVAERKKELGIYNPKGRLSYSALLGDEYSDFTTTLGSIEAKTTAANPEFAPLFFRMLDDAGIDSGIVVGISLSGSFPSLSLNLLAALQTIGANTVIFSSLGTSSYGANQPQATWVDIERWLCEAGNLKYRSDYVTYGGEDDTGGGISNEGLQILDQAVRRNGANFIMLSSYNDAVEKRVSLFRQKRIRLFINVGGNQTSLGRCSHSSTIPNGYHNSLKSCLDDDRGVIVKMIESGIPVIHILNIRSLAARYGLPLIPDGVLNNNELYFTNHRKKIPIAMMVLSLVLILTLTGKRAK